MDGGEDHGKGKVWVWGLGGLCVPRNTDDLRPWSRAPPRGVDPGYRGRTHNPRLDPVGAEEPSRDSHLSGLGEGEVCLPLHRQHSEKGSMFLAPELLVPGA